RGETWPVARRGWSLHCLGREDEALAALDEALSGPEPWWYAFSMRGWLRWQRGDLVEAEADFDRAIAGVPGDAAQADPWAWTGRGVVRAYRGRHDQARADLREAIARGDLPMAPQVADDLAELIRVHLGRDRAAVTEGLRSLSILSRQVRWPGLHEHVGAFLAHRPSPRLLLAALALARRANAELRAYRGRHQRFAALLVEEISRGLRLLQAAAHRPPSGPPQPLGEPGSGPRTL
ncbi:tetratricopeptide repeat protein, partial [Streptacidiphilus griseoplanus]|uniref:tetratricopeptide repeat protein n=1 Tax=Peterkaempfera griseoplana TaxID=66896 RepID=UPI000A87247A